MLSEQILLTESDAAELLSVSMRTLQSWRVSGKGPAFVKMGRNVRYRRDVLLNFIAEAERRHTSQSGVA